MTEEVKTKWKQKLRHMKKEDYIVLLLTGVLLLILSLPSERKKDGEENAAGKDSSGGVGNIADIWGGIGENKAVDGAKTVGTNDAALVENNFSNNIGYDLETYVESLEKRTEKIVSGMEGAGKTQVMLTVSDMGMEILEWDKEITVSDLEETDNAGGSRKNMENGRKEEVVYGKDAAGNETPYVVQRRLPQVTGVVVIAEGAGNTKVKENIIGAVSVLFNLNEHRIKVIRMKS